MSEDPEHGGVTGGTPLQSRWCFWWNSQPSAASKAKAPNAKANWGGNQHKLGDFGTVEEFWAYWNNIPPPSQVFFDGASRKRLGVDYVEAFSIFKDGISPAWEDEANIDGAEFRVENVQYDFLDGQWTNLVLGAIGETLEEGEDIAGVRVVDKSTEAKGRLQAGVQKYRLELWLRGNDEESYRHVKKAVRGCLSYNTPSAALQDVQVTFRAHT